MDGKKVRVLLEAIEAGSMMKVAEKNGYTPSGLSHLLQNLEKELGVRLVVRTNRGIVFSEDGKKLEPHLKALAAADSLLIEAARHLREGKRQVVHIAAYASIAKNWMPQLIQGFRARYPEISVELEVLGRQEIYQAMEDGKINLAFACPDKAKHYEFHLLKQDPFFAVLPPSEHPEHPEHSEHSEHPEHPEYFEMEDFMRYPFIMPSYGMDVEVQEALAEAGVEPKLLPATADDPVIISMVAGGLGVSMLTELVLAGSSEAVRKIPIEPAVYRQLGILIRARKELTEAEKKFIAYADSAFA